MIGELTIAKYRFVVRAVDPIELPPYAGSAFRGGFGHAFRRIACVTGLPVCEGCDLRDRCPYSYIFETPRPPASPAMPKANTVPHPFVLEPPLGVRQLRPGDRLDFHLILIGRGIEYFPYFLFAMKELGRRGLGRGRGRYQVEAVYAIGLKEEALIYASGMPWPQDLGLPTRLSELVHRDPLGVRQVEVEFITPTRILTGGRLTPQLDFPVLFKALRRRLKLLSLFHGQGGIEEDAADLIRAAAEIHTEAIDLRWWDWQRYSGRQQTWMKLGGVVGTVRYNGPLDPFLPYLRAGEHLHVGNGTSFGLGWMMIRETVALRPRLNP